MSGLSGPADKMADILRVTTPLVNKNQTVEPRQNVGISNPFPMQDPSRVTQPSRQSALLQQNNGMTQEETSALLLKLLKDPSVTVNFLQSISSMEAMIKLLPMNNTPFTQEIEQMFAQLLVPSDQIAQEMQRQEGGTTLFKGPLFDLIRSAIRANPDQKELRQASVSFLKALTLSLSRQETLESVSNGLGYLSESIAPSKTLAGKLRELADQFRQPDAQQKFGELSRKTLDLLNEVEESILFSDKTDKAVRMVIYNLSRYNGNDDFLRQAVSRMLTQLRGDTARNEFLDALQQFLKSPDRPDKSTVMEALGKILQRQTGSQELMSLSADKVEKIIHSLLSSPCNFTPLLHFVLPVQYQDLHSFAEVWINPNGGEDDSSRKSAGQDVIHMLLVFDMEHIGRFEMELYVRDKTIDLSLYCPGAYLPAYQNMESDLRGAIAATGYQFGEVRMDRLERPRSLMDVFHSLPYKRTGVDVKI